MTSVVRIHLSPHRHPEQGEGWQEDAGAEIKFWFEISGSSSFGRASAFQAEGGRFEPGLPLINNPGHPTTVALAKETRIRKDFRI